MAWTVLKRTLTDEGAHFELAGSHVDAGGRPFKTQSVFIALDPDSDDERDIADLQTEALVIAREQGGDGNDAPPVKTRLAVARDTVKRAAVHPVTTHSAAAGGAVLIADLLVHLL